MNKKMNFSVDHYNILTQDDTAMVLECYIVHSGENRKGTSFTLEGIKNAIPSLANKPLLILWDYGKNDFTDHGEYSRDKLTFIGNIPESNNAEIVEYQGKEFLKARCIIWKQYHPDVVERFTNDDAAKISMEIDVSKYYTDDETGIIYIEEFIFTGICLLGSASKYREGIEGAHIQVINFTDEKLQETISFYNEKYCDMTNDYVAVPQNIIDILSHQINQPQKSYSILQFCKYIIDKKFIPYTTVTEWYSKLVGTRKTENFEYYGGKEAQNYLMNTIKNYASDKEDEIKDETINVDLSEGTADDSIDCEPVDKTELLDDKAELDGDEKMDTEKEKYAMDFEDLMGLLMKILQEKEMDEYGYPVYGYYGCREEYVVASKNMGGKYEFVKMPYTVDENGVAQIDFETQIKVYPKVEYVELEEESEGGMVEKNMGEMYTAMVEATTKYNEHILGFADIDSEITRLKEENQLLLQYKSDAIRAEKERASAEIYTKYAEFIGNESKKDLDKILFDESKTIEDFTQAVNNVVLPILAVKYSELQNGVAKPTISDKSKAEKTEPLKLNHSVILDNINKKTNQSGSRLKDYIGN